MARTILLDEILVSVRVPVGLPARRAAGIGAVIASPQFAARLRATARDALARSPAGAAASVRVTVRVGR